MCQVKTPKSLTFVSTLIAHLAVCCKWKYGDLKLFNSCKYGTSCDAFQEINSFCWYNDTVKNSSVTTKHLYLILTFRSHHEIFTRRSRYSILPSLDVTISCRIKKAVVGMTQLVIAFVSIHSSMTFLADMYSFLDPPGRMVLFSVDDRSLFQSIV